MAIPTYVKNVAKSFGYAIKDTIKDYNPVVDSLLSDTKDTASDLYMSIGSFKDDMLSGSEKTLREEIKDSARDIWQNFKDDVSSGNLYQRDKKDPLADIAMKAAGLDMGDFDFDMEDWGDDEWTADDSQRAETETSVKNTKATIVAMDVASERIIKGVTKVQAQSTDYLAHVTRSGNKAMYDLNKRGFNNVSKALLNVNKSINAIAQLGKPLTEHMQNTVTFYTKTTESLEAIKNSLANIEKNTVSPLSSDRKTGNRRMNFSDIFSEDEGISVSSYIDMVKQNFGDNKWLADALIGGVKNLKNARSGGSFGKNISVTTMAMQYITKAMIPQALVQAMKGFNASLADFTGAGFIKLRDKKTDSFIYEWLKDSLFPANTVKKFGTDKYEKGRVSWDGISRKALIETIPGYLRMIYNAISGDDKVYDYDRGQFRSAKSVKDDLRKLKTDEIGQYTHDDFRKATVKKLTAGGMSEAEATKMVNLYLENAMFGNEKQRSEYYNFKDKNLASTMGVSQSVIEAMMSVFSDPKNRRMLNKMMTNVERSRNNYNDKITGLAESGDSVLTNLFNNGEGRGITFSAFTSLTKSVIQVIPGYLAQLLANQQYQLGAMGFNKGVYKYYNYHTGQWTKSFTNSMKTMNAMAGGTSAGFTGTMASGRENSTKGSTGGNNNKSSDDSSDEGGPDPEKTQEELDRINEENMKAAKSELANTKFGKAFKAGLDKMHSIFRSTKDVPGIVGSVSRMINSITYSMDTMFFGKNDDDPNSIASVFRTEIKNIFEPLREFYDKHLKQYFDKFAKWLNEKFPGIGLVKEKLKGAKTATGRWIKNKLFGTYEERYADEIAESKAQTERLAKLQEEDPEAFERVMYRAKGGYVPRTGLAVLSKGELVIPSEYNPFYNGPTNKASQIAAEQNIAKRYFGNYAKGGIVGRTMDLGAEGFGQLIAALGSFFKGNKDKDNKDDTNTLSNKLKQLTSAAFKGEDSQDNLAAMAAGGIIGGGVSLLTGAVVGPLFGAAIGAGAGLILNSKKVQNVLFGPVIDEKTGEVEGGLLGKNVSNFMVQKLPDMAKGAGLGAAAGIFLGSPVLGAIVGGAVGFAKNSQAVKEYLFGKPTDKKDKDGNPIYDEGLIPKSLQDKFKKGLPAAVAGAGIGLLAGPFGLAGNLIAGAGLGFLTTSEQFHDLMVGNDNIPGSKEKSILGQFKTKIIDNLTELFMNTGNAIKGFFQKTFTNIAVGIAGFFKKLRDDAKEGKGGFLTKLFGGALNVGGFLAKATIGLPGLVLGGLAEHRKRANIRKGYNVYNKYAKRNMTASERIRFRGARHMVGARAGDYEFDNFLAGINSKEDLESLRTAINDREVRSFTDSKGNVIDLSKYSAGKRKNMTDLINTEIGAFDPASGILRENIQFHDKLFEVLRDGFVGVTDAIRLKERPEGKDVGPDGKWKDKNGKWHDKNGKFTTAPKAEDSDDGKYQDKNGRWHDKNGRFTSAPEKKEDEIITPFGIKRRKKVGSEMQADPGDKETDGTIEKEETFFGSIKSLPVISGAIGKVTGFLGKIKDGLFGNEEKKTKGILTTIKEALFGEDGNGGFLGGLFSFFTGGKGLGSVAGIISKFAIDAGIFGLLFAMLSGKLDGLFSLIPGVGSGKDNTHTVTAQTIDGRTVTQDSKGNWIDSEGNTISIMDIQASTISAYRSDVDSWSQRLGKNWLRGTVTGTGSAVGLLAGKTAAGKWAISNVKPIATNFGKIAAASGDDVAVAAMKYRGSIGALLNKIASGLKNCPLLKNVLSDTDIDNMISKLGNKIINSLDDTALKSVADAAATAAIILKIAMIVADFSTGYEDARTTLGIVQEPTTPQRFLSGLLRAVKNCIPFVGTLIPDSLLVDVFCEWIGPAFGLTPHQLIAQRQQSDEIVSQYNAEHGTNYTKEQFIKEVMHDYTWTERIGNTVKGTWEDTKTITGQIGTLIKEEGFVGGLNAYKGHIADVFNQNFNEEEGILAGTINGIGAVMDETMPGVFGEIKKKKADIWKYAVKGNVTDLWKVSLDNFSGGGEQIEGTDLTTATAGYTSFMVGQFPLIMTKMIATPFGVMSHSFHQMFGDRLEKMGAIIKTDLSNYKATVDTVKKNAEDGDISGVWNTEFKSSSENIWLSPVIKTFGVFNKLIYTYSALLHGVGNILKGWIEKLEEKYPWIKKAIDVVEDLSGDSEESTGSAILHTVLGAISPALGNSNLTNTLSAGAESSRETAASNGYTISSSGNLLTFLAGASPGLSISGGLSGSASGFVSQTDPRYRRLSVGGQSIFDNGCAPAVASMIANAYGKTYTMNRASGEANFYQDGGSGTTLDYFADSLGSRGINVGAIPNSAGVYNSLSQGKPVVLLGQDAGNGSKSNSPFGPNNHYVMASGLDNRGNIIVNDPEAHGPRKYSPNILREVKAALGTSGRGSRPRRYSASGSRLSALARKYFRRFRGGASGDTRATIYAYFKSKGMTDFGISGLMGCWQHESGNRPDRVEGDYLRAYPGYDNVMSSNQAMDNYVTGVLFPAYDSSGVAINKDAYKMSDGHYYPGLGLAQWTRGRTYNLLQFAKSKGWDWRTLEAQLEYAWYELNSSYSGCLAKLNAANSVDEATQVAYTNYEGCGTNYTTDKFLKRLQSAYEIYNAYSGSTATFNGFTGSDSGTSSSFLSTASNFISGGINNIKDFLSSRSSSGGVKGGALGALKGFFSSIFTGALNGNMADSVGSFFNGTSNSSGGFLNNLVSGATNAWNNFTSGSTSSSSTATPGTAQYSGVGSNGVTSINNFPYFNQNDEPWKNVMYSYNNDPTATIQTSGCGPTSGAMILKSYGINTNPIEMADYAFKNGFRPYGGTSGGFFPSVGNAYGLDVQNFQSVDTAKQMLMNNIPLVALMHKGDFTGGGHYVVISGYDPATNTFTVNDSNSRPRSEQAWDWSKMGANASNFWSFSKDGQGSIGTYGAKTAFDNLGNRLSNWRNNNLSGGSSGLYNTRPGSALRKWKRTEGRHISGGASGLSTTSVSMPNIDTIMKKATSQSSNGALSPSVIYELLAAIAQILMAIAGNTGNSAQIAEMLAVYLPKLEAATGLSKEQLQSGIAQASLNADIVKKTVENNYPNNPNLNDVDKATRSLKGILGEIAST